MTFGKPTSEYGSPTHFIQFILNDIKLYTSIKFSNNNFLPAPTENCRKTKPFPGSNVRIIIN